MTTSSIPKPYEPPSTPRESASSHVGNVDPALGGNDYPHGVSHHILPHLPRGVSSSSEIVDRGANPFNWSIPFNPSNPSANVAVTTEDFLNPNMLPPYSVPNGTPLDDDVDILEGEDSIQSLFGHSFDIWGSYDSMGM